jgi:hypothetical protein
LIFNASLELFLKYPGMLGIADFPFELSTQVDKITARIVLVCGVLIAAALIYVQLLNRSTDPIIQSETTGMSMNRPGVHYSSCSALYREKNPYSNHTADDRFVDLWASEHTQRVSICRTWNRTAWAELFVVLVAAAGLAVANERRNHAAL